MKSLHKILEQLGGSRYKFTLENRIFNIACIVLSILAAVASIINLILIAHIALTLLTAVSSFIFAGFFYFSRYNGRFNELYLPFLFLINIIAGILWFLNAGTYGPIAFGYMLLVVISVIIGKRRDQVFLVTLILAMLLFLFFIEYKYPHSIIGYADDKTRFFDYTTTLLLFIFLTSIIIRALKKNYDEERDIAIQKQEEISSGLKSANKIQQALLVPSEVINKYFDDAFVLNMPREIVSGDFYWIKKVGKKKIVIAADSAGRGVSGALMSLLGISTLNEISHTNPNYQAKDILLNLHERIRNSLRIGESTEYVEEGLDLALCIFDDENKMLQFSGAGNPIYLIRNNKLKRLDADNLSIGINSSDISYSNTEIELEKDDRIYMFTDGYIDQFGGAQNRKFMAKQFKELLLGIHQKSMSVQRKILVDRFNDWKGMTNEQVDDVLILGMKI